ncbi:hypothetical protein AHF37_09006 [Paragonimus kellicotti]|nr:hypothetical protein AHF37_09006 [Paragonimus kellicotti]
MHSLGWFFSECVHNCVRAILIGRFEEMESHQPALNTFEQHNSTDPLYAMLQVDCELRNVSLIPSPTRPGR